MRVWYRAFCIATLAAGCGVPPSVDSSPELPDGTLANGGDFVQVSREALSAAAPVRIGDGSGNFYLAVRRMHSRAAGCWPLT